MDRQSVLEQQKEKKHEKPQNCSGVVRYTKSKT